MSSDAVSNTLISRIVGYKITKGNFSTSTPNLPQRIAILAEANTANQADLVASGGTDPYELTTAQAAGKKYGYGSPIHMIARILLPKSGGGVSGIPIIVYPQVAAVGATSKKLRITPSGVATDNGTHTFFIAGRDGVDGNFYSININLGDTTDIITAKISDAVNNVLGSPVIASDTDYYTTLESKWKGKTANLITASVDDNGNDLGISYVFSSTQSAAGTPSVQAALDLFANNWNTIVVNSYGTESTTMTALETFNGIPDPVNPTGRYASIIMKPFIAITGSTDDDASAITNARLNNVTIALAVAPNSAGLPLEAAANYTVLFSNIAQNNPQLDIAGQALPDMPTPSVLGSMSDYATRDAIVKKGSSTVDIKTGQYIVEDFVTTYHPAGEDPAQFRYCRILMIDFNVRFGYYLLEQQNVVDHVIAADSDTVSANKVIKPKQWKQIIKGYALDLAQRALIVDADFMEKSIVVSLSTTNPDRLETFFRYKRSGFTRISSTTAEAGFNFGTLQ